MIPARVLWDAARRGAGTFAVGAAVGVLVGAVELLAVPVSAPDALASGGLWFLLFHHAALTIELPPLPGAGATVLSVGAALMLGTLLAGWLLLLAGRRTARPVRAWWPGAMVAGSLVAVPYALLSFVLALVVGGVSPEVPAAAPPGVVAIVRPSPWSALVWTLLVGLLCGSLGGLATGLTRPRDPRRALLAGGWRMAWTAVALSFTGLLVVAAVHPSATRAYFDRAFGGGPDRGTVVLTAAAMVAPNATTWALAAAMGGSLRLGVLDQSCTLLSYGHFPRPIDGPGEVAARACGRGLEGAPPGYFLFLLVPLASTVTGGHFAVRRAGLLARRPGALMGAGAGVVGAAVITGLMVLARVTVEASGPAGILFGEASLGPDLASGSAVALLWGVTGGAVGGVMAAGRATGPVGPGPVGDASARGAYGAGGGAAGGGAAGGGAMVLLSWKRSQAP